MTRRHGVKVAFDPKGISFTQDGEKFMTASYKGNVGYLDGKTISVSEKALAAHEKPPVTLHLLHRRLGHTGSRRVRKMINGE